MADDEGSRRSSVHTPEKASNPRVGSTKGKEIMHGERNKHESSAGNDFDQESNEDAQPIPSDTFKYDYVESALRAANHALTTGKTVRSDPFYTSPFVDKEAYDMRVAAHGIEVVHNSLGDDMAKLAALPEPWNNVGDIWARAKYDFPIRAHFGVFAEEYSRIEGVDERAKFLDLLMSGCKVRGIPAFIWKFPDMDPGNALRNITDSDQRVKFFAPIRQIITKRVSRLKGNSTKDPPGVTASQKQSLLLQNFILGLLRRTAPYHLFGRSKEAIPLVEAQSAIERDNWQRAHPEASAEDVQKNALNFTCSARRRLFERLPDEEKAHWTELAMKLEPKTKEDIAMLVLAAFPIVSNFLNEVSKKTRWHAVFVGMAKTSDGKYNLMLSEQGPDADYLRSPGGLAFVNSYKLYAAAKYKLEASTIQVFDLPEPEDVDSSTFGAANRNTEALPTLGPQVFATPPTFRDTSVETLTKADTRNLRKLFSTWFMDNMFILHARRPKWSTIATNPDSYYVSKSLPLLPDTTGTRRYHIYDPGQMTIEELKAVTSHISQSYQNQIPAADAFLFRGRDGRSNIPILHPTDTDRTTSKPTETQRIKKNATLKGKGSSKAKPSKTNKAKRVATPEPESEDDGYENDPEDDSDDEEWAGNVEDIGGDAVVQDPEEDLRHGMDAESTFDDKEEVPGVLDPMSEEEDNRDGDAMSPEAHDKTNSTDAFTTLRLAHPRYLTDRSVNHLHPAYNCKKFVQRVADFVQMTRLAVIGVSNPSIPLPNGFPHASEAAMVIWQLDEIRGSRGTACIDLGYDILNQDPHCPEVALLLNLSDSTKMLALSLPSQSFFPEPRMFRAFVSKVELLVNDAIWQLTASDWILGDTSIAPTYLVSLVRFVAFISRSSALLVDTEDSEKSTRALVARSSRGIQIRLTVVLAATAIVRYLHFVLEKVAEEYAADADENGLWERMVALVNGTSRKLSEKFDLAESDDCATLQFSYQHLNEQLPTPIQGVLGTILMQPSWWQISKEQNPLRLEVKTSVSLIEAGMVNFIESLSQKDWDRFTFFEQFLVIILMFFTAIQVSSQSAKGTDGVLAMSSLVKLVMRLIQWPQVHQPPQTNVEIDLTPPPNKNAQEDATEVIDAVSPPTRKRKAKTGNDEPQELPEEKKQKLSQPLPSDDGNATNACHEAKMTAGPATKDLKRLAKSGVKPKADETLASNAGEKRKPGWDYEPCTSSPDVSEGGEPAAILTGPQHRPRRIKLLQAAPVVRKGRKGTSKSQGASVKNIPPIKTKPIKSLPKEKKGDLSTE